MCDPIGTPGVREYSITIRGRVGDRLLAAFSPLRATTTAGHTVLHGPIEDQSALHGVLAQIQSLGLELEEVRLLPGPPASPGQ